MYSNMMLLPIMFKERNITHAIMPQTEVCSNNHPLNRETLTELIHKIFSRHSRNFRRKGNHDTFGNSSVLFCQGKFLVLSCQITNVDFWPHNEQSMWPEGHQYWPALQGPGQFPNFGQQTLVSQMDAVKIAN